MDANASPMDVMNALGAGLSPGQMNDVVQRILQTADQNQKWSDQGAGIVQNQADQGANIVAGMQPIAIQGQTTGQANNPSEFMQDIAAITGNQASAQIGGASTGGSPDRTMDLYKNRADARTQQAQQINSMIQARGQTGANLLDTQTQAAAGILGHQMDTQTSQTGYQKDLFQSQVQMGLKLADIYLSRAQMGDTAAADLVNEVSKIAPAGSDAYGALFAKAGEKETLWRESHQGSLAGLTHERVAGFVREAADELKITPKTSGASQEPAQSGTTPRVAAIASAKQPAGATYQPGVAQGPTSFASPSATPGTVVPASTAAATTPTTAAATASPVAAEMAKQKADIIKQQKALQQQYDGIQASKDRIENDNRIPNTEKQKMITDLNTQQMSVAAAQRDMIGKAAEVEGKAAAAEKERLGTEAQTSQAFQVRNGIKQMRTNVDDAMGMLEDIKDHPLARPGFASGVRHTLLQAEAQAGNVEASRLSSENQHIRSTLQESAQTLQGILFPGGGGATDSRVQLLQRIASTPGDNYGQIKANLQQMKDLLSEKGAVNTDLPGGAISEQEFQQHLQGHTRKGASGKYFAKDGGRQVKPDGTVITGNDGKKWIIKGGAPVPYNQ